MLKSNRGITLVALVITIIVLLILAGVSLSIVVNGGLIDQSQNSVDTYVNRADIENNTLDIVNYTFNQYLQNLAATK